MGKTPVKLDSLLPECAEIVDAGLGRGIVTRNLQANLRVKQLVLCGDSHLSLVMLSTNSAADC